MNIYFACSITGGREDEAVYQKIVATLLADGHTVPTALLAGPEVVELEMVVIPEEVYRRDIAWIDSCDLLVAEVSTPSHGVGYEIGYVLSIGKPVLCLHHQDAPVSKMLTGNTHPGITVRTYPDELQAIQVLRNYIQQNDFFSHGIDA